MNPYAIYVYCDGAMDYDTQNSGGIGFRIEFPDFIAIDPIEKHYGIYEGANIHVLELEALIRAINETIDVVKTLGKSFQGVTEIIFLTDRYNLRGNGMINEYSIREWRKNNWRNHENLPIKHHRLLDQLDKARKKLRDVSAKRVSIEYIRRKFNRKADKLSKKGKTEGQKTNKLKNKGEKIGRRHFPKGNQVIYPKLNEGDRFLVHVFKKTPVQNLWEVMCEICIGEKRGEYMSIYCEDDIAKKMKRLNFFRIRIKTVHKHHVTIYKTITKLSRQKFIKENPL